MECPKCGAENPAGAANCNLCFHSFVERPPVNITVDEETPVKTGKTAFLTDEARSEILKGGVVGAAGGLLFLTSLTIIHVFGLKVFDFLFSTLGVNQGNLSIFILFVSLFALICGGIGGNLENKREIVPVVRSVAALAGAGIWAGLVFLIKPADVALIVWLKDGAAGIVLAFAALPITAMFLGLSESFGEDMSLSGALWGAIGGFLSGIATAAIVAVAYIATPIFGTAAPAGALSVIGFSMKLAAITVILGFFAGAFLWLAIKSVDRFAS